MLLALAAALTGAAPAWALSESELKTKIGREMRAAPSTSGAYVRDLDSGEVLYSRRADRGRIPASVEKLFTTSATLLRLGPAGRLRTLAVTSPDAIVTPDGTLRGDLVIVGGGDPFFGDETAARLARSIRAAGIRRVSGAIVGDESAFDDRRASCCSGYDPDLGGVLSALAYDRGIYRGRARLDAARFGAQRFAARLRTIGVRSTRASRAGRAPRDATTVATAPSRTASELARFVNVPSNNFAAEMLLKGLGARYRERGTRGRGAVVVRDTLRELGLRPKIVDGSGLSRRNRASPRQIVGLLQAMHDDEDVAEGFRGSMALAGVTGTVRRRMRGTAAQRSCRVKTGTLRGVSALAGYCRAAGGREIAFALLFNRASTYTAKQHEDRIAVAIARLSDRRSVPPSSGGSEPEG